MKSKKLLAGPYLFWSVSFIIIPLLMIFYYGLTDQDGAFTFANLAKITTPGFKQVHRLYSKSDSRAIADVITMHGETIDNNKPYTIFQPDKLYCIDLHPSDVDEFFAPHARMADFIRKEWCDQQYSVVFPPAAACDHQHTLCDHSWYGL